MAELGKIINSTPPQGWKWQVINIETKEVLRTGVAETKEGAESEADRAITLLAGKE